jgi:hypothetical protein
MLLIKAGMRKELGKRQGFSEFLMNEVCDVIVNIKLVAIKPLA